MPCDPPPQRDIATGNPMITRPVYQTIDLTWYKNLMVYDRFAIFSDQELIDELKKRGYVKDDKNG